MIKLLNEFKTKRLQAKGQILLKKGKFEKACEVFSTVLMRKACPENYFNYSIALMALSKYSIALKQLNIIYSKPDYKNNELIILSIANCNFMLKNFDEAISFYKLLLSIKPNNESYKEYLNQALDINNRDKIIKAKELFNQAQKIIPEKKFTQAFDLILQATKLDETKAVYFNNLGSIALQLNKPKKQIVGYFEKAVTLQPSNKKFVQNLAYVKMNLKK